MKAVPLIVIGTVFASVFVYAQDRDREWEVASSEGLGLFHVGDFAKAESKLTEALRDAEQFGEQDPRLWRSISNLAMVREDRGEFAEAETLMRRVLELHERFLPSNDTEIAISLNNLAAALHSMARDSEADPLLRRALTIMEQPDTHDDKTRAAILNGLGLTLLSLGEKARAEPVLRRAVGLFESSTGESIETAKALNNLAVLHRATREYATAEMELKRALPIYEKVLGEDHPLFAGLLGNLFTVLAEQKRYVEGEPYLRRALDIADRGSGAVSAPSKLLLRIDLAALESNRGNYSTAAKILQAVIPAQERALGPAHPQLALTLENYAAVLRHLNQKAEAKRVDSRANAILKTFH